MNCAAESMKHDNNHILGSDELVKKDFSLFFSNCAHFWKFSVFTSKHNESVVLSRKTL